MLIFIDFWTRLMQPNLLIGMIVAIIGIGMLLLSRKIVVRRRGTTEISKNDKALLAIRGFGLVFVLIAMLVMIIQ